MPASQQFIIFKFLLILTLPCFVLMEDISVPSCCPISSILHLSSDEPSCGSSSSPIKDMPSILTPSFNVNLNLNTTKQGIPQCSKGKLEVHKFTTGSGDVDTWVSKSGHLITSAYGEELPHENFCVGRTEDKTIVAIMCSPCYGEVQCLNLCCPHGEAFLPNPDYDYSDYNSQSHACTRPKEKVQYRPKIWHSKEHRLLSWERNKDFILVSPNSFFECPQGYEGLTWAPEDLGDFKLLSDGSLVGLNLPDHEASIDGQIVKKNLSWSADQYCLIIGSPPDYNYYEEDNSTQNAPDISVDLNMTYMHCVKSTEESWQERFQKRFHPIALMISVVFLILTLIIYLLEKNLRETVIGKITIGFIMNLTLCFIIIVDTYIKDNDDSIDRRETLPCIISGYLTMYFFHAFFFWLNTMAFQIWLPLSSWSGFFTNLSSSRLLLYSVAYAQGIPFIICCVTAIVDASGKGKPNGSLQLYPEMGVYNCFLGSQKTSSDVSYFSTPVFIYYHSVVLLLVLVNLLLLILTMWALLKVPENKELKRRNFLIFLKLFFILGFLWIADLITAAIAAEHGFDKTFHVRLFLDLVNLFAGVLVFLVLICNKSVLGSLWRRIRNKKGHSNTGEIQMTVDQEKLSSSAKETSVDTNL